MLKHFLFLILFTSIAASQSYMSDTTVDRSIVDSAVATCIDTIFKTPKEAEDSYWPRL